MTTPQINKAFLQIKIFLPLLIIIFAVLSYNLNVSPKLSLKTIAIIQFVEHAALDEVRQNFVKTLEEKGYKEGKTVQILYRNAQGNIATNSQIAQDITASKPDLVFSISTPSAQAMAAATKNNPIPVVFAAVTDPISSQIVRNPQHPEGNITGITDAPPMDQQLELIQAKVKDLKVLGVLYNPGETNSVTMVATLKKKAAEKNITLVEGPVLKTNDIGMVVQTILPQVDALYVPLDNNVVSVMAVLAKAAHAQGKLVFASDSGSVDNGADVALSYSYEDEGTEAALMAIALLEGKMIKDLPVHAPKKLRVYSR